MTTTVFVVSLIIAAGGGALVTCIALEITAWAIERRHQREHDARELRELQRQWRAMGQRRAKR